MLIEGDLRLSSDDKILVINSRFNHIVTDRLTEGAKDSFVRHGGKLANLDIALVPGAFEIPLALKKASLSGAYTGICCLGAIIRGSTPHFDYIAAEATKGVASVALTSGLPVSYGVLTTNTIEQAIERAGSKSGNKGFEAMSTLIEMINLFKKL